MRCHLVAVGSLFICTTVGAQVPLSPQASTPSAPRVAAVPTYWVLLVTGDKDGVPWMKTSTPETLGGTVKGTGVWSCAYAPTKRGSDDSFGFEEMEVSCGLGEAEVFVSLRCNFSTRVRPGKVAGKSWKRSELATLNLRRKGDAKSVTTVSLRCDVDAAYSVE